MTSITNPGVSYTYDANGNMLTGDGRVIAWDVENRPVSITKDGVTTTFVYDGDGNRVKKTVGGVTTIYVNQYYEKTGSEITTSYYLGGRQIAVRTIKDEGASLSYVHQDHLGSTSVTSDISSESTSAIKYFPYGDRLESQGNLPTDKLFTGQRLDGTGLYYYGGRYYDPSIGRFISADTIVSTGPLPAGQAIGDLTVSYAQLKWLNALNQRGGVSPDVLRYNPEMSYTIVSPQETNRYSYALNNPLRYTDPDGNQVHVYFYYYFAESIGGIIGGLTGQAYINQPANTRDLEKVVDFVWDDFKARCSWYADKFKGWFGASEEASVPQKAKDVADYVKEHNGEAPEGYEESKVFENREGKLPTGTKYKEYDVNPNVKGQNRGAERIVVGEDGSVWYTGDHYRSFTRIK